MISLVVLVVVALLAAIVAGALRSGRREPGPAAPAGGLRQFVVSILAYGLLVAGAVGVARIVGLLLPTGPTLAARGTGDVAAAVSLTVVAVPAFLGLWRFMARRLDADPEERNGAGWAVFVTVTHVTFLIGGLIGLGTGLAWLFGLAPEAPTALGFGLVWTPIWIWSWTLVAGRRRPGNLSSAPVVIGSLVGLGVTAGILGATLGLLFSSAYDRAFGTGLAGGGIGEDLGRLAIWLVLGAAVWWWHWLRHGDAATGVLRDIHLLVFGVLAGTVVALAAAGAILYSVLEWLFGDTGAADAARHFSAVPGEGAALLVGLLLWSYHRGVVVRSPGVEGGETARVYRYLLAGAGLVTAASGLGVVVNALLGALVPPVAGRTAVVDLLLGGMTALVIGLPVWWRTWAPLEGRRAPEETASAVRRVYLTLLAGLGGVVAVVSAIVLLYRLLESLLEGERFAALVDGIRAPLGVLVATAVVAVYHLAVWRADRAAIPAVAGPATAVRHVVLVAPSPDDTVRAVEAMGPKVTFWRSLSDAPAVASGSVVEAIEAVGGERVLVVVDDGQVRAYPLAT